MKRGVEMIIGIFAILSCGAQYVPLDGSVVADSTLRHVVEECGKTLIVCVPSSKQRIDTLLQGAKTLVIGSDLWGKEISADDIPVNLATPISGCYVIYTSGKFRLVVFYNTF
jgi:non-ribosomal peptide synthetase component F